MQSCLECGGKIEVKPNRDGVIEEVCMNCGLVSENSVLFPELLVPLPLLRPKRGKKKSAPAKLLDLLNIVDPNWRFVMPFLAARNLHPIRSLFTNPFKGKWGYKDYTARQRYRTPVFSYDERYVPDMRYSDRRLYDLRLRELIKRAFSRFSVSAHHPFRRRRGLFAACLYVESILQCLQDIKLRAELFDVFETQTVGTKQKFRFHGSKRLRDHIRAKLVKPRGLEHWSKSFELGSKKTIMQRLQEIEQESPPIREEMLFVKQFLWCRS